MAEITENLHRAELTVQERAKMVAEWCELVGEKPAQLEQVSGGRGNRGGDAHAARELNLSRGEVQRSKKIASLSPEAQAAAVEEGLDNNQSALLDAAKVRQKRSDRQTWTSSTRTLQPTADA